MRKIQLIVIALVCVLTSIGINAQELDARVNINHSKIGGTDNSVYDNLQEALTEFINERQWTNLQFKRNERISCTFNIVVNKYDAGGHNFECQLLVTNTRPVFNSAYTTTVFSTTDDNFNFEYKEYDKLDFRADVIDNDLTALIGFYAYLIIGMDMDTYSPLGGTDYLETCLNIANNAQSLTHSQKGWKPFSDKKNRYAIINDYMDGGMEPMRQMMYQYHREGLDVMAENSDRARAAITEAMEKLKQVHADKPLSLVPQLFTEYKRDEIVGIYQGKANSTEKDELFETLSSINASMNTYWRKIQE